MVPDHESLTSRWQCFAQVEAEKQPKAIYLVTFPIVTNVTVENVTYATVTYLDFVNSGFDLDLLSIVYNRDYP